MDYIKNVTFNDADYEPKITITEEASDVEF
jgi:hypothetical protein